MRRPQSPDPGSRYAFLLDKALLICKRRGDSYDLKDFVNLHNFQVRDDSSGERDNKKVGFCSRTGVPVPGTVRALGLPERPRVFARSLDELRFGAPAPSWSFF